MLVTDIRKYGRDRNLEVARQVLNAGIETIHVREKHSDANELLDFTLEMIALAEPFQARVIVNDRLDVALSSGASGVHLDDDALHPEAAREQARLLELDDFLVGVQVRNRADVARASAGTADYVLFGPVFSSPDEAEFGESLGIEALSIVCADKWVPVLAAGGITPQNVVQIMSSGAAGMACTRVFFDADDPGEVAQRLVEAAE